jgi:hypothetical protein
MTGWAWPKLMVATMMSAETMSRRSELAFTVQVFGQQLASASEKKRQRRDTG